MRRDLQTLAFRGLRRLRVMLAWDVFMPSDRAPNPRRMRDLETVLTAARELGVELVLTLFAQSLGDCVMLPAYAIDRRSPRRGVRCLTEARAVEGGPRDIYTDPLMLEAQVRWLDAMLAAFAQHPAVAGWDLGYDPARTVRPRRIEHMRSWAELLGGRVRDAGERCRLTVGQEDVLGGRAVRLHRLAGSVDQLGVVLRPQRLLLPGAPLDPTRAVFVSALALALAGGAVPLGVEVGIAVADSGGVPSAAAASQAAERITFDPAAALRATDELLSRLVETGVSGISATSWWDWGPRLQEAPPADRNPGLAREGIVSSAGDDKLVAPAWDALLATEHEVAAVDATALLGRSLDVDDYYAHLPDSMLDVHASWQGAVDDPPAILGSTST